MTESSDTREAEGREALAAATWHCYTFTEGKSNKFWKIRCAQRWMETWWGRIGTKGQRRVKEHSTPGVCGVEASDAQREKQSKGYVRQADERPLTRQPQRDPVSGRVAVYALRDVYSQVGSDIRLIHARGLKQMLRPVDAGEVVTGSRDYGYWHPDEVPPEEQRAGAMSTADAFAAVARSGRPTAEAFQNFADAARSSGASIAEYAARMQAGITSAMALPMIEQMQEEERARQSWRISILDPGPSRPPVSRQEEDTTVWGVSYGGRVATGTMRKVRSAVDGACTNSGQMEAALEVLRRLIAAGGGSDHVRSRQGTDLGIMVVQRQGSRPVPVLAPTHGVAGVPWEGGVLDEHAPPKRLRFTLMLLSQAAEPTLQAAAWHTLVHHDQMYWRLRFAGRLLEIWAGRDLGAKNGTLERRRYFAEEHVLTDARDLVLAKLRDGYLPHPVGDQDDFVFAAARTDAQVYARVMAALAEALKPRSAVALGRFYSLDEDEEI